MQQKFQFFQILTAVLSGIHPGIPWQIPARGLTDIPPGIFSVFLPKIVLEILVASLKESLKALLWKSPEDCLKESLKAWWWFPDKNRPSRKPAWHSSTKDASSGLNLNKQTRLRDMNVVYAELWSSIARSLAHSSLCQFLQIGPSASYQVVFLHPTFKTGYEKSAEDSTLPVVLLFFST